MIKETPESLRQAVERLLIIAEDMASRVDKESQIVRPLGMLNSIYAVRLIIDRLERESDTQVD